MSYTDFVLPADWASAIINNDYSGLTDDERYAVEDTLDMLGLKSARSYRGVTISSNIIITYRHDAVGICGVVECLTYSFY